MYGAFVNQVYVANRQIERGERLLQEEWRFRHLESLERRVARAILAQVVKFLRSPKPASANPKYRLTVSF